MKQPSLMALLLLTASLLTIVSCGGGGGSSTPITAEETASPSLPNATTFPGASWAVHSPADLGVSQAGVDAALDYAFAAGRNTQSAEGGG